MSVTAALLVKDPPLDRLALLREYLRPIVSELVIVVDDRTAAESVDVMASWDAVTLVPYFWRSDFSNARNAALPYVTGDWVLIVDPDELPSMAMMEFVRSVDAMPWRDVVIHEGARYPDPLGFLFWTVSYWGGKGGDPEGLESDWHVRLFRKGHGMFYKPVHEQVMLGGVPEGNLRGTPYLPKAPRGAYLIHSKPADRIEADTVMYSAMESGA